MSHSHTLQSAFSLLTLLAQVSCHAIPKSAPAKYPHLVTTHPHSQPGHRLDLRSLSSLPFLHHFAARKAHPMEMPDSVPYPNDHPAPPSHSWIEAGTGFPISYRIAIALDAFVLFVTIGALILLGVYVRRQYRRRRLEGLINGRGEEVEILSVDGDGDEGRRGRGKRVDRQSWGSFGSENADEFDEWNGGNKHAISEKVVEVGRDNQSGNGDGRRGVKKGHGRSSSFDPHSGGNGGGSILWESAPIQFDLRVTEPQVGGKNGS